MEYQVYKSLRESGQVKAGIDRSSALKLVDYLPKRYQYAQFFWSWIWLLSIPAGIYIIFFVKWWIGLLVIIISRSIRSATKESGAQFVLSYAEENEEFFNKLVKNDILIFRNSP